MHLIVRVSIALLIAIAVGETWAQTTPARPTRVTFEDVLRREDANDDGKVTREEFNAAPRIFQRFDRNQDGVLTQEDFSRRPEGGNASRARQIVLRDIDVLRDVVFGKGGDRELTMHIVVPKKKSDSPSPVYVWIHGGGWQGGTKETGVWKLAPLVRDGFVGATIEYRLTAEAPFPAQIQDCKCAIRYLRAHADKFNIDPDRIAVGGSSAGGHLAALMGTSGGVKELEGSGGWADQSSAVQAVVDLYGPTDFKAFVSTPGYESHNRDGSPESKLLGGGEVLPNEAGIRRVNPITYVDPSDPPFLIFHGSKDRTVPPNQSEALHKALQSKGVESTLSIIDGAGHGGPEFANPEIRNAQRDFLGKHLKSNKKTPD